jgi:hypothetical protein
MAEAAAFPHIRATSRGVRTPTRRLGALALAVHQVRVTQFIDTAHDGNTICGRNMQVHL